MRDSVNLRASHDAFHRELEDKIQVVELLYLVRQLLVDV